MGMIDFQTTKLPLIQTRCITTFMLGISLGRIATAVQLIEPYITLDGSVVVNSLPWGFL
jgi:hypothetical protein